MKLSDIKNGNLSAEWAEKGYELPKFDVEAVKPAYEKLGWTELREQLYKEAGVEA